MFLAVTQRGILHLAGRHGVTGKEVNVIGSLVLKDLFSFREKVLTRNRAVEATAKVGRTALYFRSRSSRAHMS